MPISGDWSQVSSVGTDACSEILSLSFVVRPCANCTKQENTEPRWTIFNDEHHVYLSSSRLTGVYCTDGILATAVTVG